MTDAHSIISKVKQKRISERLVEDKRLDGRGLLDYRDINLDIGVIDKAEGSALVSLGKTKVLFSTPLEDWTRQ